MRAAITPIAAVKRTDRKVTYASVNSQPNSGIAIKLASKGQQASIRLSA